jgi:hypothetical protein
VHFLRHEVAIAGRSKGPSSSLTSSLPRWPAASRL